MDKKYHISLIQSPLGVNKYLMERKFRTLSNGSRPIVRFDLYEPRSSKQVSGQVESESVLSPSRVTHGIVAGLRAYKA